MDWYSAFRRSFFGEWSRQGLPESSPSDASSAGWPAVACPLIADTQPGVAAHKGIARGLDPKIVNAVYGFGLFIGETFGRLQGARPRTVRGRAEFCGQFNLGISLFDLVCDEGSVADRVSLQALPSLQVFTGVRSRTAPATPTLALLDRVAASVLTKLAEDIGPAAARPLGLWRTLSAMFEAQIERAGATTAQLDDAEAMRRILRLSSSEPFRVMSEWMVRDARVSPSALRQAAHLGRCVGDCYWLIDDARDVWEDLNAGRWNLFLVDAKAADPSLRLARPTPFVEARLANLWEATHAAERASQWSVGGLAKSLQKLAAPSKRSRDYVARIHASMLHWYG